MSRTLLIAATVLTCACNHNSQNAAEANAPAPPAAQTADSGRADQTVTLVGCLRGPEPRDVAATTGSNDTQTHGTLANARFTLTEVAVESGGQGTNGAGATGGPLLSPGATVDLDGVPADAQRSVNKQVRIKGRIDARPAEPASGAPADATAPTTTSGSVSSRDDVRANSTAVASGTHDGARRVTVESVETVAQNCSAR